MKLETKTKPYSIEKKLIYESWLEVAKNGGSAGVDKLSIEAIKEDYQPHLYKLWNRMSSGSYMALPIKKVEIPKSDGKTRTLGIPTVLDRVAQMAVVKLVEPKIDSEFHPFSYGYRPGRSAHEALKQARDECLVKRYVVDLDIQGFFDNIPHDKMMEIVEEYIEYDWAKLYIHRWLTAEMQDAEGNKTKRDKGTPQGGVISPLLANLYLHVVFDSWMQEHFGDITFERYADDIIIHCITFKQANYLLKEVKIRMKTYGLNLHPDKTKIVYCKMDGRNPDTEGSGVAEKFDFLGYTFQIRTARNRHTGKYFNSFSPAIGNKAKKKIKETIKKHKISKFIPETIKEIAVKFNPMLRGWINYYGKFRKSELTKVLESFDMEIRRWIRKKYKETSKGETIRRFNYLKKENPKLFAHWYMLS